MSTFSKHVSVRNGFDTVWFKPGDKVPGWALDKVGPHVLAADQEVESENAPAVTEAKEGDIAPETEASDAGHPEATADEPDFTKPAPAKKRAANRKKA